MGEKSRFVTDKNPGCTFRSLEHRVAPMETHQHFFYYCETSQNIIRKLVDWEPMRLLGAKNEQFPFLVWQEESSRVHSTVLNSIYIWTKYFLFACAKREQVPSFVALKKYLMSHAKEMHNLLTYKNRVSHLSIIFRPEEYTETVGNPGYVAIGDIYSVEDSDLAVVNING